MSSRPPDATPVPATTRLRDHMLTGKTDFELFREKDQRCAETE